MVGGGATSQLPPPSSSSAIAPPPTTEEEEFLKRNTDCVYFLASPLTCKKGSECEYRHSDIARVNPRDCWYWLNGNCLNPKCGFRHPPLDGLLGAEVPTPVGPSIPQAPVTTPISKQGVACIFFQKGFCLKGHLCPFLHGPPNMVNNKSVQPVQPNPVTKMASAGPEKSIQEKKFMQQESSQNPVEFLPPQGKQVPRTAAAPAPARNGGGGGGGGAVKKNVAPPPEEPPRYRPASVVPPVVNEFPASRSNHGVHETHYVSDNDGVLNGKDIDEYSREPTPGFDVLVDNELGDSEYYPNEEQFGRDFDIGHSTDYDVDRDMYGERRDYDHRYNDEGYAWEDRRTSSERVLGEKASNFGRKRYPRDDSPDQFDKSDLRHRISKQRRGNVGGGLRSVVSSEHHRDSRADRMPRTDSHHRDRHHRHHDRRLDPGSLSSRLRGRIKIPGRSSSSPGNENELRVEREIDMGRQHRSRYSPHTSSNHNRLRDRIKGRAIEDLNDHRGSYGRREMASDNGNEFSGPKRLSELRSGDDHLSLGKRKYPRVVESQISDGNLSFEGPKPLSEILKRKRGGSVVSSVNNEDNNKSNGNNEKGKEIPSETTIVDNNKEEEAVEKQSGLMDGEDELEKKVGSADEDAMLDQELEAYDGRDGDYDYEQMDGEYNLEEGEEYLEEEEEDDDDGGKKEKEVYS